MGYRSELRSDSESVLLPDSLKDHLTRNQHDQNTVVYSRPEIGSFEGKLLPKRVQKRNIDHLRLPARLNSPLVPYTDEVRYFINNGIEQTKHLIHGHHLTDLKILYNMKKKLIDKNPWLDKDINFDINTLKRMAEHRYGSRTELIHLSATSFACRATEHEYSIMMKEKAKVPTQPPNISLHMHFLCTIQRLRMFIAKSSIQHIVKEVSELTECIDPKFTLYDNACYTYHAHCNQYSFVLIMTPGHFQIFHSQAGIWFAGPSTYFDYMFTLADINNNLNVIGSMDEYRWAAEYFKILTELTDSKYDHNNVTDFMKSSEGLLLNLSDYDEDFLMNWPPLMDILFEMYTLDKKFIGREYDFKYLCMILKDPSSELNFSSPLMRILRLRRNNSRIELQELSSLHKFIFYSEVNSEAGIEKFLKRVHTKRPIDDSAIKQLVQEAKRLFFIEYCRKHKTVPNLLGSQRKIQFLKLHINKHDYQSIHDLPNHWWEEVTIFNCMDNTLTDDALEFAKDKGALKSEVRYGPGDSRKELLQAIEKPDYKLKDFFSSSPFIPLKQSVKRGHQQIHPIESKNPVRLIPKEREQKYEARLFANGELSNKHSLSVIATKIKKVLSYFDEQLMTPTDKKRKELLHVAAQDLKQDGIYSLMLDIEGHNQSMQYRNTSELSEFCGMLFGESGWGELPNYFSILDIYHYDEYNDDVIVSNGQFGGIEGWLNPLWTLHTTLMMKLLRRMTDITVKKIMVYSDDVNALIKIDQASNSQMEATFNKITDHCMKFGMITKMSQTNLSKHRVTMLRQHYADGQRADSTLKKLISTSGANNPMLFSESIEISGICSSISSALDMTNHIQTCTYLKNYKIGVLLARLPHIILSNLPEDSYLSLMNLPTNLANLLYQIKDDTSILDKDNFTDTITASINDIKAYLGEDGKVINKNMLTNILDQLYKQNVDTSKFIDQPDRLLYLQIYDKFLTDLLFYWVYTPTSIGGLGGSLTMNLVLSGHSSGLSKSLHYIKEWICNYSENKKFFLDYLEIMLSIDTTYDMNMKETRLVKSYWPCDMRVTDASTSISQSIKSMIKRRAKNINVLKLFQLDDDYSNLSSDLVEIFRGNFHPRIVQFYYENTSTHFLDLLISKIETSSGLLTYIRSLSRLRQSLVTRTMVNIRISAGMGRATFGEIQETTDIIQYLIDRRIAMFPKIELYDIDEPLYDDKLDEVTQTNCLLTARKCSPMHFENGIKVFDMPDMGNEITYKGELLDDDRMLGNKEELIAARLVAVTKWLITKILGQNTTWLELDKLDCAIACNLALQTLTAQTLADLWNFSPNETGGEILHRIPNMRFSNTTYIRSEPNTVLQYTVDLSQREIFDLGWLDSNINFDYLRLRVLLLMTIRGKFKSHSRVVTRWSCKSSSTIQDVQYITPKISNHSVKNTYICYGTFREHKFSELRFRYMAAQYLNIEEVKEMALMPNLDQLDSGSLVVQDLIAEIVLNYATHLDKEYMRYHPKRIEFDSWEPLINKISKLSPNILEMGSDDQITQLKEYLMRGMILHNRISLVSKDDRLGLTLQSSCITYMADNWPLDEEFMSLSMKYKQVLLDERVDVITSRIIEKYRNRINQLESKRNDIAQILICEYVIRYIFHTRVNAGIFEFNASKSLQELIDNKISENSLTLLDPHLSSRMKLIGFDKINNIVYHDSHILSTMLHDIASSNNLSDVVVPANLPSLGQYTSLAPSVEIPRVCSSCEYMIEQISIKSMSTISDLKPLLNYARKCVDIASVPETFTSLTGSDSMVSQYGLFKMLLDRAYIDSDTKICDLTAGRGDGCYVLNHFKLKSDSFAKPDIFTSVYHHPDIRFLKGYDISKPTSIRFIEEYDWIHCDISFTGNSSINLLDLILYLEEHNLAYSIRLNSISLEGYRETILDGLPEYDHFLSYAVNNNLKPYQVYLIGMPSQEALYTDNLTLKESTAFRSMALSFSRLLKYQNFRIKNTQFEPNSMTLYLGDKDEQERLICDIAETTKGNTYRYYLTRVLSNNEDNFNIWFVPEMLDPRTIEPIQNCIAMSAKKSLSYYLSCGPEDIGDVNDKVLPFHVSHVYALHDPNRHKVELDLRATDTLILKYFRQRHPIARVRALCESVFRMKEIDVNLLDLTTDEMKLEHSRLSDDTSKYQSRHQSEYQDSIRLLIISASENDYTYGIRYLHNKLNDRGLPSDNIIRMLKMYRLLSHMYDEIKPLIASGKLKLSWIKSVRDMMITRKKKMYRKRRDNSKVITDHDDPAIPELDLDIDFEKLFMDIQGTIFITENMENSDDMALSVSNFQNLGELDLNMNINQKVNEYLDKNKDMKLDKFGRYLVEDYDDDFD